MRRVADTLAASQGNAREITPALSAWAALSEYSPLPMVVCEGITHTIVSVNPAFCHLSGKSPAELRGTRFPEALPVRGMKEGRALLDRVYRTGRPETLADQEPLQATSEEPVYWSYVVWAVPPEAAGSGGVIIQVTDTTETTQTRQHYEKALQEIRESNQQLLIAGLHEQELAEAAQESEQRAQRAQQAVVLREQEAAVLAERTRIAEDFHDTLAQYFTGIKLQLDLAEDLLARQPQEAGEHIQRARDFAGQSICEARRCIQGLRSQELAHRDLGEALARLVEQSEDGSASVRLVVEGTPCKLSLVIASNLFHFGQESLTNALRHACASQITVTLTYQPDQIRLRTEDNGQGFDPEEARVGFGLLGLRERAARLGGEIAIQSASGQGTVVMVTVYLPFE